MRFLIDAQPLSSLVHFFRDRGHEATHVFDLLTHDASDEAIFQHAITLGAVIVTKDEDYAVRSVALGAPPQILWLRIGNCRNGPLVNALSASIATAFDAFERGERIVEIRGR